MSVAVSFFRCCHGCAAWLAANDASTGIVWCSKCRSKFPPHASWVASLKPGDRVWVQPYVTNPRYEYTVLELAPPRVRLFQPGYLDEAFDAHMADLAQYSLAKYDVGLPGGGR